MTLTQVFKSAYEAVQESRDHYIVVSELTDNPGYQVRWGQEGFPPSGQKQVATLEEAEKVASQDFCYVGPDAWKDNEEDSEEG